MADTEIVPSYKLRSQFAPKSVVEQRSSKRLRMAQIERLTDEQLAHIGSVIVCSKKEELEELRNSSDASFLQVWVASLMIQSLNSGDVAVFDKLMTRIVGKPKERIEISNGNAKREIENTDSVRRRLKLLRAEADELDQ